MTVPETRYSSRSERLSFSPLNFRAARQQLVVALVASIVVPLVLAALYAWHTYGRVMAEQSARLNQLAWVAESNLTNLLDVSRELAVQASGIATPTDTRRMENESTTLNKRLEAVVAAHRHVAALSVYDSNGQLLADSGRPRTSESYIGKEDFDVVRSTAHPLYIFSPQRGRDGGPTVIKLLFSRTTFEGRFDGATVVSVYVSYLAQICQKLIEENPELTVGVYREDGAVLTRIPRPRVAAPPPKHAVLQNEFARGTSRGIMEIDSPLDGIRKLLAYRRAGEYPVYASAGLAVSDLVRIWLRDDMSIVLVALIPCICLWLLIAFSLRRLRAEEASWRNWRRELSRRRSAEASTRQLQRMGALGNLVASVAHDFNNLLMVVTANMEIARRKNYSGVKNEVDAVERASSSARETTVVQRFVTRVRVCNRRKIL
ncbi:hypothetical protein [Caballeronia sp. ATUFL_M2_KS44]|uniref:hypothetical protein n=1 Tax=Caballeronia sp. ATUFL_M2_KS44 TaxID=2921767 RepID=UPI002029753E|nr:hypothetical protein [Caballeronia sp. ATUFL_M2_KS44]